MKNENGFTLAELLIVVAIIAVLVAIAIPVFSDQLEKSRETVDLSNVRDAYAEVMSDVASGKTPEARTVSLQQQQDGWSISTPITIGGITSGENGGDNGDGTWVGTPTAGQSCTVSYTNDKPKIVWGQSSSCILSGTLVTLADGSTKLIDDVTADDLLETFDFHAGTTSGNHPLYVLRHEDMKSIVITVTLDSGAVLEISDSQMLFDMDTRDYFEINAVNCQEAVGRNVMTVSDGVAGTACIAEVTEEERTCASFEIFTEYDKNFVAGGVLTLEPGTWRQGVYHIGQDLKIDMEQYRMDAEEYGLYTYEEFSSFMTEEQFEKMGVADAKIAVGQGVIDESLQYELWREWMPVYTEAMNDAG